MLGLPPAPASACFFASGLAEALGVPYRRGLSKNRHVGRSFISPDQQQREQMVRAKLNPIRDVVAGRKVAVVDDSIVRGTTSRHLVRTLRQAGAREVYYVSASPPHQVPVRVRQRGARQAACRRPGAEDAQVGPIRASFRLPCAAGLYSSTSSRRSTSAAPS